MNAALLVKLFGREQRWTGPCTIVMDAEATVQALGVDSIVGGGTKQFAPRMVSGRIPADSACLLADGSALIVLLQQKVRAATGEETIKQTMTIADSGHVVAIEFSDTQALVGLGLTCPPIRPAGSHHGLQARPI